MFLTGVSINVIPPNLREPAGFLYSDSRRAFRPYRIRTLCPSKIEKNPVYWVPAGLELQGTEHKFIQVERDRIPRAALVFFRADDLSRFPGDIPAHADPFFVPAPDQPASQACLRMLTYHAGRSGRHAPQGIPVEIDDIAVIENKPFPEPGEGITAVQVGSPAAEIGFGHGFFPQKDSGIRYNS
jgi:hypothetical protein